MPERPDGLKTTERLTVSDSAASAIGESEALSGMLRTAKAGTVFTTGGSPSAPPPRPNSTYLSADLCKQSTTNHYIIEIIKY